MRSNHPNIILETRKEALQFTHGVIVLAWQNVRRRHLATSLARESNRVVMSLLRRDINEQLAIGTEKRNKADSLGVALVNATTNKESCWFTIQGVPGEIHLITKPKGRNKLTKANLQIIGQNILEIPGLKLKQAYEGKLYLQINGGEDDYQPRSISLVLTTNHNENWDARNERVIAEVDLDEALLTTQTVEQSNPDEEDIFEDALVDRAETEINKQIEIERYEKDDTDDGELGGNTISAK